MFINKLILDEAAILLIKLVSKIQTIEATLLISASSVGPASDLIQIGLLVVMSQYCETGLFASDLSYSWLVIYQKTLPILWVSLLFFNIFFTQQRDLTLSDNSHEKNKKSEKQKLSIQIQQANDKNINDQQNTCTKVCQMQISRGQNVRKHLRINPIRNTLKLSQQLSQGSINELNSEFVRYTLKNIYKTKNIKFNLDIQAFKRSLIYNNQKQELYQFQNLQYLPPYKALDSHMKYLRWSKSKRAYFKFTGKKLITGFNDYFLKILSKFGLGAETEFFDVQFKLINLGSAILFIFNNMKKQKQTECKLTYEENQLLQKLSHVRRKHMEILKRKFEILQSTRLKRQGERGEVRRKNKRSKIKQQDQENGQERL